MGAFIARQPNGLLCRFSTIVDTVTHWNMTDEDYLSDCTGTIRNREDAQDTIDNYMYPFSEVLERLEYRIITKEETNKILKEMGYNNGY